MDSETFRKRNCNAKTNGPNPLSHVGVTYSESGDTGTLWEMRHGKWEEYSEIDGSASFRTGGMTQQYRGKGFNLGNWYLTYDWIADNGYNNFGTWVG